MRPTSSFPAFAASVLGWSFSPKGYAGTDESPVPPELETPLQEGGEVVRPDFAVRERDPCDDDSRWQLLVKVIEPGDDFDRTLYEPLWGVQAADDAWDRELLREALDERPDDVYHALLTVILRLVFLLYAEERDLLPEGETFARHYSLAGLYERLRGDRYFRALDVGTGEVLRETRLGQSGHGLPISYAAGGKQYVAVPTGVGILRGLSGVLSPDIYQPRSGNGLYVFALPDQEPAP